MKLNILMMKYYTLLFSLLLVACTNSTQQAEWPINPKIHVNLSLAESIDLSSIYTDIDFIALETTPASLLGNVFKIRITDDRFFIKSGKDLCVFENNGKFLFRISREGKGPGEYSLFVDFYVDAQQKTIDILDGRIGKTIIFDWAGNFLREEKHNIKGFSMARLDKEHTFIFSGSQPQDDSPHKLNYLQNQEIIWGALLWDLNEANYLYFHEPKNFYKLENEDAFSFFFAPNDTIYTLTETELSPKWIIDYGEHTVPPEFYKEKYEDIADFILTIRKRDYALTYGNFIETSGHIIFDFSYQESRRKVFHSKITGVTRVAHTLIDNMVFKESKEEIKFGIPPSEGFKDKIYRVLLADDFLTQVEKFKEVSSREEWENFEQNHPEIIRLSQTLKPDDNHVLFIGTLKH